MRRRKLNFRSSGFGRALRERFNGGEAYRGPVLKWDTIIEQKTNELGRFLTGKQVSLDFLEPAPKLERHDSRDLRVKILALTLSQAKQLGIGRRISLPPQERTGRSKIQNIPPNFPKAGLKIIMG